MTTLDDKILGEKSHYYCSSSSSEGESDEESDREEGAPVKGAASAPQETEVRQWSGTSSNTGPKGVLKDWQRYKQLETEKRIEQEKIDLAKRLALSCTTSQTENNEDPELLDLMNDDILAEFRKQRMEEMFMKKIDVKFGQLVDLRSGPDFVKAIDDEQPTVTIIVHIYEECVAPCKIMNNCLSSLAADYPHVKFCKLMGSVAGLSHRFKVDGIPALLVYKGGQMVGNFIRVTDDLGDEFYDGDVENFLIEHGMIVDRFCVPSIISKPPEADEEGSDFSLE